MSKIRHLSKAPIVEAIIEIQTIPAQGRSLNEIEAAYKEISAEFGEKKNLESHDHRFTYKPSGAFEQRSLAQPLGIVATSKDGRYVAQFRTNGYALSRLKPYEDWKTFLNKAQELWAVYEKNMAPQGLTRFGVRYINEMERALPASVEDIFETETVVLPDPFSVNSFVSQAEIVREGKPLGARILVATEVPSVDPKEAKVRILVDIDAFKNKVLGNSAEEIEKTLEELHQFKNEIFFSLMTEETIRVYE